jgi:hypothetical protein
VSDVPVKEPLHVISAVRFDHSIAYHPTAVRGSTAEFLLWLKWVIASTLGGIGGGVLALSLGPGVSLNAFVLVTATAAAGQWLLLRRFLPGMRWWVLLSAIGGGVGALMVVLLSLTLGVALGILVAFTPIFDYVGGAPFLSGLGMLIVLVLGSLAQGAMVGTFQWLNLRNKTSHAQSWITASALGVLAAGIVTFFTPAFIHFDSLTFAILNTGINQGVAAAVTGIVLIRLIKTRI